MIAGTQEYQVVAFLQNPWFLLNTAERHILMYRDDQPYHRRLLVATMSGRRLRTAFDETFNQIWWDNSNWRPDWMPDSEGPDYGHMADVIWRHSPKLVITFGTQARDALLAVRSTFFDKQTDPLHQREFENLACHHPNARGKTQEDLNSFARQAKTYLNALTTNDHATSEQHVPEIRQD